MKQLLPKTLLVSDFERDKLHTEFFSCTILVNYVLRFQDNFCLPEINTPHSGDLRHETPLNIDMSEVCTEL